MKKGFSREKRANQFWKKRKKGNRKKKALSTNVLPSDRLDKIRC